MSAQEIATASAILTSVASTVELGRYSTLAGWVVMLYDHIVHFDKEVELFWLKPWSVAKGLYIFVRTDTRPIPHNSVISFFVLP
jgi:hypothetical protein